MDPLVFIRAALSELAGMDWNEEAQHFKVASDQGYAQA
jgi:hypothetical protein